MRLLLAEDEKELSDALVAILKHNNYSVDAVYNGADALDWAECTDYDGIILDIMMPKVDGMQVMKRLRDCGINTPILFLTAKSSTEDKILGLDMGADDYITKPFDMGELLARIRAMTRRKSDYTPSILTFGNVSLNRATYEVKCGDNTQKLGNKEFQMLEALMVTPGNVISTEQFMDKIWGYDSESEINVVWVYISTLRKKLTQMNANIEIRVARGLGYSLELKKA